jgi:hypothetical protein
VPLDQQHVAGHAGHGEASDEITLTINIDMSHDPAGRRDFTHERCHLPAGPAPRRGKIQKHDVACGHGRGVGTD